MARKEHKGGQLTNEQVEQELARTGAHQDGKQSYQGSQDNGDEFVRTTGNPVQRTDGAAEQPDKEPEE